MKLRRQKHHDAGPDTSAGLGALGTVAGMAGSVLGSNSAAIANLVAGGAGMGSEGTSDGPSALGAASAITGITSSIAELRGLDDAATGLGAMGNGIGVVSGLVGAFDQSQPVADQAVSGLDAFCNALGLTATAATRGQFSLTAAGSGVGEASTLLGSGVGEIAGVSGASTAGFATAAGAAGAVIGAGVGGYQLGSLLNDAGTADTARDATFGEDVMTGRDRTAVEWWTDEMAEVATDRENRAWQEAHSIEHGGDLANGWLDRVTGTDAIGDWAEGAADGVAGVHREVGSAGAHLAGGVSSAVGAIPLALFGSGLTLGHHVEDAMGPELAGTVRSGARVVREAGTDLATGAWGSVSSLFD